MLLPAVSLAWSLSTPRLAARTTRCHVDNQRMVVADPASSPAPSFAVAKQALIDGLRREYESFFQPMETELYSPEVEFVDPLIEMKGVDAYRQNVDMLAGTNLLGRILFTDCALTMHNIESPSERELRTRWTLQFRFKLLPWRPLARFSGVSCYMLDERARVLSQIDYWDSVNLKPRGSYESAGKLSAIRDLVGQLAPSDNAEAASQRELPYVLLRRTSQYEVRRYPQHLAAATAYTRRVDGFGTLGAYTNGANEEGAELAPYVPSLMAIPTEAAAAAETLQKVMRWPMYIPSLPMGMPLPPRPSGRLEDFASLEMVPSKVVAVFSFSEPTTEPIVRGYAKFLRACLAEDGLTAPSSEAVAEFELAQFDALNSLKTRRNEIWIPLEDHPW